MTIEEIVVFFLQFVHPHLSVVPVFEASKGVTASPKSSENVTPKNINKAEGFLRP